MDNSADKSFISKRTHYQNPKFGAIPVQLEDSHKVPIKTERLTYKSTYVYGNKYIVRTKEVHQLHETLDGGYFEIYFGLN